MKRKTGARNPADFWHVCYGPIVVLYTYLKEKNSIGPTFGARCGSSTESSFRRFVDAENKCKSFFYIY